MKHNVVPLVNKYILLSVIKAIRTNKLSMPQGNVTMDYIKDKNITSDNMDQNVDNNNHVHVHSEQLYSMLCFIQALMLTYHMIHTNVCMILYVSQFIQSNKCGFLLPCPLTSCEDIDLWHNRIMWFALLFFAPQLTWLEILLGLINCLFGVVIRYNRELKEHLFQK